MTMQGARVEYRSDWAAGDGPKPGEYWKTPAGLWAGVTPNGHHCNLARHKVIEHPDGTISVSPSIKNSSRNSEEVWHGYLEHGVWREC